MPLPMQSKPIISDASCFIALSNIGELNLLRLVYGQIVTTPEIAKEFGENLPNWVEVVVVINKEKQKLLEEQVDKGEASAIALALESEDPFLILDDYWARKLAERLKLNHTGTIGIILAAKQNGIISSIKPLLEKIKQTNFRLSPKLEAQMLLQADENDH
jgi:predicted nucleic acid-binding protein